MTGLALFLFMAILYAYFGYFLIAALLGLFVRKKVVKDDILPSVTLMIAAYNEENDIAAKIENSLALDYPNELLEIVVVSDASSDRTDDIVLSYANKGVKLFRVEGRVGKTQARNIALKHIGSDIVLFSDATTEYRKDLARKMVRNFADPGVGMVTGQLRYKAKDHSETGLGQKLFWLYESRIKKAQTEMGTLTGSVGCASAFRRKAYTELPPHIIEDFTEPLMFILKGYRVVYEEEAVCHEYATEKNAQEWTMRVRVIRGGLAGLMYARQLLNPFKHPAACFQLFSHKLLRWLCPLLAIALFAASFWGSVAEPQSPLIGLLAGQVLFYAAALFSFFYRGKGPLEKVLALARYFFIVNAAALAALYKTASSPLEPAWDTRRGAKQ